VGGLKTIKVDVRLVVATNINLEEAVTSGAFRQDLFYRLNVVPIHLPPLRQRPEDIPPLVDHFMALFNTKLNRQISGISDEAVKILAKYSWPGNIRELENIMERAVLFATGPVLKEENFSSIIPMDSKTVQNISENISFRDIIQQETERLEKELLINALNENGGNVTKTAKKLGLSRKGVQIKMKRYGLQT
jgi:two-component system, NtrC family, response regulator AtoC